MFSAVFSDSLKDDLEAEDSEDNDFTEEMKARLAINEIVKQNDFKIMKYEQLSSLIDTIKHCGIDKSILYMFNKDNQLSTVTNTYLPSIEDFASIDSDTCNKVINGLMIAGNETFLNGVGLNGVGEFAKALFDDFLKPFRAGQRWLQSLKNHKDDIDKVHKYCDIIKQNKYAKLSGTLNIPDAKRFADALAAGNTSLLRNEANMMMRYVADWERPLFLDDKRSITYANKMRKLCSQLSIIEENVNNILDTSAENITETDLSKIHLQDYLSIADKIFDRISDLEDINRKYPGYWKIGIANGSNLSIQKFAAALMQFSEKMSAGEKLFAWGPTMIFTWFHRGIIGTASNGWKALSQTSDIDWHIFYKFKHATRLISERLK